MPIRGFYSREYRTAIFLHDGRQYHVGKPYCGKVIDGIEVSKGQVIVKFDDDTFTETGAANALLLGDMQGDEGLTQAVRGLSEVMAKQDI